MVQSKLPVGDANPEPEEKPRLLSPTAINTYLDCNRLYYYKYILRLPSPDKVSLKLGTVVHGAIEDIFKWRPAFDSFPDLDQMCEALWGQLVKLLNDWWEHEEVDDLFPNNNSFDGALAMLRRFYTLHRWKMEDIYDRYRDLEKAWFWTKPRFRELYLKDENLGVHGYVDKIVQKGDEVVIVDYKTSKIYKHGWSRNYQRQLLIYAYLFREQKGILPEAVSLEYLRYGHTLAIPIREEMLDEVEAEVNVVKEGTVSRDLVDYAPDYTFTFCKWCDYRDRCLADTADVSDLVANMEFEQNE